MTETRPAAEETETENRLPVLPASQLSSPQETLSKPPLMCSKRAAEDVDNDGEICEETAPDLFHLDPFLAVGLVHVEVF